MLFHKNSPEKPSMILSKTNGNDTIWNRNLAGNEFSRQNENNAFDNGLGVLYAL